MADNNITKAFNLDLKNPDHLFHLLNVITMVCGPVRTVNAFKGAKALVDAGLINPDAILKTPYWDKVKLLNRNGYARFDESRARFFEQNAKLIKEKYNGKLHNLLGKAEYKPAKIKELIKEMKGVGPVAANLFVKEIKPQIKLK